MVPFYKTYCKIRKNKYKLKGLIYTEYHSKKGRNSRGIIIAKHRGGGHKRLYRIINFGLYNFNEFGRIKTVEYDPNRNTYICLIHYSNGHKRYIIHTQGIVIGDIIYFGSKVPIDLGNILPLSVFFIPLGMTIYNIETIFGKGGKLVRAGGSKSRLISKEGRGIVTIRLPSAKIHFISQNCLAVIGQANIIKKNNHYNKAGHTRWLSKRPVVRGVSMNLVDHPHRGCEGKSSIGRKKTTISWGYTVFGKKNEKKS
uniref:Ribosomal protein L2 n=1 Tax=Sciaphila thaidanica TaxID=2161793 RepID=A0A2R4PAJ2_9LILI|nr:ribosomal protein L2 [Sciaphila thaidanica]